MIRVEATLRMGIPAVVIDYLDFLPIGIGKGCGDIKKQITNK